MNRHFFAFVAVIGFYLLPAGSAWATALTAGDILNQFNLVVFNDLDSSSHVDGRTYVGGSVSGGAADFFQHGAQAPASDFAALTVGGNVTGGDKKVNSGGNARIDGDVDSLVMNGGSARIGGSVNNHVNGDYQTGAAVIIPDFETTLRNYSSALSGQGANGTVDISNNGKAIFTSGSSEGLSVFDLSATLLSQVREIQFAIDPDDRVLINVNGTPDRNFAANFLGDYLSLQPNLLWNFHDALGLDFNSQFRGSILAPDAAITNFNNLEGSVVANSFVQRGEVHLPGFGNNFPFTETPGHDIPEPMAWLLFAAGVAGIGFVCYRRRAHDSEAKPLPM